MTQVERYLEWLRYGRELSDNTIKSIENDLKQFTGTLEDAIRMDIEMFVMKQNKEGLASATVARRVASLKGFFEWQLDNELRVGRNPASGKVAPKIKHNHHKAITSKELSTLYNEAKNKQERAAIGLMGYAGLRIGEVMALGNGNTLYEDDHGNLSIHLTDTKGGKERDVSLALIPEPHIIKEIAAQGGFKGQRGLLTENGMWRRLKNYFSKMGFKSLSPHDLRATFSTMLVENDVNVAVVRDMLGHSSLQGNDITSRYVSTTPVEKQAQEIKEAFNQWENKEQNLKENYTSKIIS